MIRKLVLFFSLAILAACTNINDLDEPPVDLGRHLR